MTIKRHFVNSFDRNESPWYHKSMSKHREQLESAGQNPFNFEAQQPPAKKPLEWVDGINPATGNRIKMAPSEKPDTIVDEEESRAVSSDIQRDDVIGKTPDGRDVHLPDLKNY